MNGGYYTTEKIYKFKNNPDNDFKIIYHVFENIPFFYENNVNEGLKKNINNQINKINANLNYYYSLFKTPGLIKSLLIRENIEDEYDVIIFMQFKFLNKDEETILGHMRFNIDLEQITLIKRNFVLNSKRNIEFTSKHLNKGYYIPTYVHSVESYTSLQMENGFNNNNRKFNAIDAYNIIKNRLKRFSFGKSIWNFFNFYLGKFRRDLIDVSSNKLNPIYFFVFNTTADFAFTYHIRNRMKMMYSQLFDFLKKQNKFFLGVSTEEELLEKNKTNIFNLLNALSTEEENQEEEKNSAGAATENGSKSERKRIFNSKYNTLKKIRTTNNRSGENNRLTENNEPNNITNNSNNLNQNQNRIRLMNNPNNPNSLKALIRYYDNHFNSLTIKPPQYIPLYKDLPQLNNQIINELYKIKISNSNPFAITPYSKYFNLILYEII